MGLVLRVMGYWLFCLLTVGFMVFCWEIVWGPNGPAAETVSRILSKYVPVLVGTFWKELADSFNRLLRCLDNISTKMDIDTDELRGEPATPDGPSAMEPLQVG
jgi:hypothetical protein